MDMAGNVWEWCLNKYGNPEDTTIDISDDDRVFRGGALGLDPGVARAAGRGWGRPGGRSLSRGFRVVCASPIVR
jgi:formylglycine-generating enzyme required for sulfatase activity